MKTAINIILRSLLFLSLAAVISAGLYYVGTSGILPTQQFAEGREGFRPEGGRGERHSEGHEHGGDGIDLGGMKEVAKNSVIMGAVIGPVAGGMWLSNRQRSKNKLRRKPITA